MRNYSGKNNRAGKPRARQREHFNANGSYVIIPP
jgi:hypothetical protein